MSDQWDFFLTSIDEEPASIRLDLDPTSDIDSADYPSRIRIDISFVDEEENGMPTSDEWEAIHKIDDAIEAWAGKSKQDVYVAAVTWSGRRSFFLYSNRTEAPVEEIKQVLARLGREEFDIHLDDDPDWREFYEVLYPTPIDMQWMGDRDLVERLRSMGDNIEAPRAVDHTAIFRNVGDRERFVAQAVERGYTVASEDGESTAEGETKSDDDFPFSVTLARAHSVDLDTVHKHTRELCVLADECQGMYDGWGCGLVK